LALYGGRATLAFDAQSAILELPLESPDRHRC
jgi:hypothetical protein